MTNEVKVVMVILIVKLLSGLKDVYDHQRNYIIRQIVSIKLQSGFTNL